MSTNTEGSQKLGATALSGYWRQGLAELRAAAPYGDSGIAQPTNYAMPGMATPGEVTEARHRTTSHGRYGSKLAPTLGFTKVPEVTDCLESLARAP